MRFFVKIQFDVHNRGMATDRHQAPSYPLRMPEELKAKVQAAADESGRSLHAELLFRIEASFAADAQTSAEALMLEMKRTQLLLRRAQVQADASRAFFGGSDAAKKERAYREANPDPDEVEDAKRHAARAKLSAGHLRQELFGIDGRLLEIEGRLQKLGYAMELVPAEDPTDHPHIVMNRSKTAAKTAPSDSDLNEAIPFLSGRTVPAPHKKATRKRKP